MKKSILQWSVSAHIEQVAQYLAHEQVILGSSDTVFGLLAPATEQGFNALNRIKNRSDKPYILLCSTLDQVLSYTIPAAWVHAYMCYWPAPLTLILPARDSVPYFLKKNGAIACRIPDHVGLQHLLRLYGAPLFSTSANMSGNRLPDQLNHVDLAIIDAVAACIDGASTGAASTLVDCTQQKPVIIRQGDFHLPKSLT